jgi:hypothetical protein
MKLAIEQACVLSSKPRIHPIPIPYIELDVHIRF